VALPGLNRQSWLPGWMHLEQFALIVPDYDDAIRFFVNVLGFELVEDSPSLTNDARPKRWVVVRPPGATTALLLAQADGEHQASAVGNQFAGRVGLFLRVDDFENAFERMRMAGVEFITEPRDEPYGRVVVFVDVAGNRRDLLGRRLSRGPIGDGGGLSFAARDQ
jgi:catechol 2,3-dioxygenase-like lactoylglutathione lyase family enzyme